MSKLCPKHTAEHMAWLSYKAPAPPVPLVQVGFPSVARAKSVRTARYEDWRRTIRSQHKLIADACKAGHGCSDDPKGS